MSTKNSSAAPKPAPSPFDAPDADIILRSSDNVDFRVHRSLLAHWSPHWASVLHSHRPDGSSWLGSSKGVPIVGVDEDAATTSLLLRYIYPGHNGALDVRSAFNLLPAARKYTIVPAIRDAKKVVAEFADEYPLRAYAVAEWLHMDAELRTAAEATLRLPLEDTYDPILEQMRAGPYARLLAYHRRCTKAATAPLDDLRWMVDTAKKDGWIPAWATCTNHACPKRNNTAVWYWEHLQTTRNALARAPCRDTLEDLTLIEDTLRTARACAFCASTARKDLEKFNELLAERVERDVEVVSCFPNTCRNRGH